MRNRSWETCRHHRHGPRLRLRERHGLRGRTIGHGHGHGCLSLGVGAFSENGPFRPNGQALTRNNFSWNKEANMLYQETPVGVASLIQLITLLI